MNDESDLSSFSMLDLFRTEVENQVSTLTQGLLLLEKDPTSVKIIESLMRAAHSIKGAARIVQIDQAVKVAHALEDCFVAAQSGKTVLKPEQMDILLQGVDLLTQIASLAENDLASWQELHSNEVQQLIAGITSPASGAPSQQETSKPEPAAFPTVAEKPVETDTRTVRIQAENLNRLLGYAAETSVSANWLQEYAESLRALKNQHNEYLRTLNRLLETTDRTQDLSAFAGIQESAEDLNRLIADRHSELETYSRRAVNITKRLYREVLHSRMRPFGDCVEAFPRMVRDVSRKLGKKIRFEISGKSTKVDRDILEKLEAPLNHLVRNAIDHGIGTPEERAAAGKPEEGALRIQAAQKAGMLHVAISDDGRGVDFEKLRLKLLDRKLVTEEMAGRLSDQEMLEFLFLPGFSTASQVTELSGRGFGLDVVYNMVRDVGGTIHAKSAPGFGMTFLLQLPITLSVVRTLLVEISGDIFAFPLSRIDRTLIVSLEELFEKDGCTFVRWNDQDLAVVSASEILELLTPLEDGPCFVIVISDALSRYGVIVDRFLQQKELVVRPLDSRLGKIKNIQAAAILEDGAPTFILDVQDMVRSIDHLLKRDSGPVQSEAQRKRILIVEDSITVRETEKKLLESNGFEVNATVDGMDGWNALQTARYDLVITDIDMPRMNGIELTSRIKEDASLKAIPVLVVSYKDRDEDRKAASSAGANLCLSKSSFQDDSFLNAVARLLKL